MADKKGLSQFPDIKDKLNAPKKISVFERQRQEAESKRLREEAETRKALRDFEDSFADEDEDDDPISRIASGRAFVRDVPSAPRGAGLGSGGFAGPRHFPAASGPRSAGPGTLGPPPNLKRKRDFEDRKDEGMKSGGGSGRASPAFGRSGSGPRDGRQGLNQLDDDDDGQDLRIRTPEPAVRKPTMLLSGLPHGTKANAIKSWMPSVLKVEDVTFVPAQGSDANNRRTLSALVTVAADTPISEVDNAVSAIQSKYLGFGLYLNISRHVSSSTGGLGANMQSAVSSTDSQPFGAKAAPMQPLGSLRNAPPPSSFGNYPPPNTYAPTGPGHSQRVSGMVQVPVVPPSDIKQLKIIHRTVEQLVSYGSHFEALLMSRPEVQQDEKWAWLFNASSHGGVYYRWLIWKHYSEDHENWTNEAWNSVNVNNGTSGLERLFDSGPMWMPPTEKQKYEHVTAFEELVEDEEYVSSEDESGDEGVQRQFNAGSGPAPFEDGSIETTQARYLNPYRRAKFTHLLARLPDTISMLRTGDVARVTNFVINNAGQGAEEIVDMLILNVEHPFRVSVKYDDSTEEPNTADPSIDSGGKRDVSNSKLIALYLISDALQASSTSGVRDAWKYRSLFESALKARKTFSQLGRLEKEMQWGRLKAEQWKRKVGVVLALWEQWSVFPADAQDEFKHDFNEPPLTEAEQRVKDEEEAREKHEAQKRLWRDAGADRDQDVRAVVAAPAQTQTQTPQQSPPRVSDAPLVAQQLVDKAVTFATVSATAAAEPVRRKARPTAADLISAASEPKDQDPAPAQSTASATKPGGFGFSMSLGAGSVPPVFAAAAAANVAGFAAPVERDNKHEAKGAEDMFADSDRE